MTTRIFLIKLSHTIVYLYMCACLVYVLVAGIMGTFNLILLIALISILVEGLVLLLNGWSCPFTRLAEKYGAKKGSVTDIFMPDIIARNTFRFATVLFVLELVLLAFRYFS